MKTARSKGSVLSWLFAFAIGGGASVVLAQGTTAEPPVPPPVTVPAVEAPAEKPVEMSVVNENIKAVLMDLQNRRPGAQFIIDPDVEGKVTFSLPPTSWDAALKLITETNGLRVARIDANIYRISKGAVAGKNDITVDLLTKADVAEMPDEDAQRLAAILRPMVPLTPAMAREELAKAPQKFVKVIQVENRPALEVVRMLATKAGLNFTCAADLSATAPAALPPGAPAATAAQPISLHLSYLSVEEAMKLVASQGGLLCLLQGGVWTVKPMPAQMTPVEPLKTETFQVQFLPVDDDLIKTLQKFLTERGKISFNKNKIVVRDTAESIENVRNTLAVMDTPTPQVVIEARLFQITEDAAKELGFKRTDGTFGTFNLGTSGASAGIGHTHAETASPVLPGSLPVGTAINHSYGGIVGAVLDLSAYNSTLMALNQTNGVHALSNPKITVSSDQQATINIGRERPIIKQTVQQGTGAGGTAVVTFELDGDFGGETVQEEQLLPSGVKQTQTSKTYTTRKGYLSIGTRLSVMPSVKNEDQIYVKVVPELTSEDGDDIQFGTGAYAVKYPKLKSTRVKTEFTIRNGQTIAIGGLVDDQLLTTKQTVPVLGSIPLIGRLFSYSKTQKTKVETLIFLTVTLVPTEKLHTTVGLPIRSTALVDEVDRIKKEDLEGAAYDQERTRKEVKTAAEAEAKSDCPWWKKSAKKTEDAAPAPKDAAPVPAK